MELLPIVTGVAVIFGLVIPLGFYIWYGFALSRLFPKLGEQGWKGWVPILNEMVILERGGVPGWSVVLYFLPIVSLYGLYLKATALIRIGQRFGQGTGLVVLGLLLPPLWATLLAGKASQPASEHYGERIQGMMTPAHQAPTHSDAPAVAPMSHPLFEPASVSQNAPFAPLSVPPVPPAPPMPPMAAAEHVGVEPFVPEPRGAESLAGNPLAADPLIAELPINGDNPWAPRATATAAPVETPTVGAPPPSSFDARANVAEMPTIISSQLSGILNDGDDDDLDRTVVVDRRPLVHWNLVTESGVVLPLKSNSVLLGRKPTSTDVSVELVAVPDETRTLSKNHARLDLQDEVWTITDLMSTNGVILVEADGKETELPSGGSAAISEQFILGNVSLSLTFENGAS